MEGNFSLRGTLPPVSTGRMTPATITRIPSPLMTVSSAGNVPQAPSPMASAVPFLNPPNRQVFCSPVGQGASILPPPLCVTPAPETAFNLTPSEPDYQSDSSSTDPDLYRPGPSGYRPPSASTSEKKPLPTKECELASDDSDTETDFLEARYTFEVINNAPTPESPKLLTQLLTSGDDNHMTFQDFWWKAQMLQMKFKNPDITYRMIELDFDAYDSGSSGRSTSSEGFIEKSEGGGETPRIHFRDIKFERNKYQMAAEWINDYLKAFEDNNESIKRSIVLMAIFNMEVKNKAQFGLSYEDLRPRFSKMDPKKKYPLDIKAFNEIISELSKINVLKCSLEYGNIELTDTGIYGLRTLLYQGKIAINPVPQVNTAPE